MKLEKSNSLSAEYTVTFTRWDLVKAFFGCFIYGGRATMRDRQLRIESLAMYEFKNRIIKEFLAKRPWDGFSDTHK